MHLLLVSRSRGFLGRECTFPAKWSARRLSLSSRDRYAPQTSQTCSFDCDPLGSWLFRSSRCEGQFWTVQERGLPLSLFFRVVGGPLGGIAAAPWLPVFEFQGHQSHPTRRKS